MTHPHPADGATLTRNDGDGRYELRRDDELLAIATFHEHGNVTTIPHTETRMDLRGHGIGAVLVAGVLDELRAQGRTVEPQCWFVAQFIDENPAYRDLLA
ncbi:MAG: N-acetyltransferase [Acidimicrobiales bacterium]|nr:N-acetyltransferase [Acidimicrobiales bacterium]